jgi:hypothetical protein
VTYNERILSYLTFYPTTALILVQVGNQAAAQPVPAGVQVQEHNEYYVEFQDADGNVLARQVWPD